MANPFPTRASTTGPALDTASRPSILVTVNDLIAPPVTFSANARPAFCELVGIAGEGDQGAAAPLRVNNRGPIDKDHQCPGAPGGTVFDIGVHRSFRPGQRRTERIGRVGGRQYQAPTGHAVGVGADEGAHPVDGTGRGELGGAEPLDEVAAPDPARLLEGGQHPVDRGEPADGALGRPRRPW